MIISISTSKGGGGKTTLTSVLATSLYSYKKGVTVAMVDIDPQQSIVGVRKNELPKLKDSAPASLLYRAVVHNLDFKSKPYPSVYTMNLYSDFSEIKEMLADLENKYDLVLIDFPGSLNLHPNTLKILRLIDYIFIPLYVSPNDFRSTVGFLKGMMELKGSGKIKARTYIFFNKYTIGRGKNASKFTEVRKYLKESKAPLMENSVYDSVDLEGYSTIVPPKWSTAKKNISHWVDEVFGIIKEKI